MSDDLLDAKNLKFTRFRLKHQNLASGGSGCHLCYLPTQQIFISELNAPYCSNRLAAVKALRAELGIEEGSPSVQGKASST